VCSPSCGHGNCSDSHQCQCEPGWDGAACDIPVCDPSCVHGTCSQNLTCACNAGWNGTACDEAV
jgi:hypothetical protein